ncbi:MAG: ABC transporter permease [Cellulosilyticaceae bacterium]
MNLRECLKGSIRQLLSNKLRTFLTMLGMFIGIGAVIMVLSIGEGVKTTVINLFADIGKGAVQINVANRSPENLITQEDLEVIRQMPEVQGAVTYDSGWMTSMRDYKEQEKFMIVSGIPYNFHEVQYLDVVEGRNISEGEDRAKANVVLVSDMFAKAIYGVEDAKYAIGKTVEMNLGGVTNSFEIIGLVKTETFPGMPMDMIPLIAYVPFSTLDQIVGYGDQRASMGAIMVKEEYNPSEVAYQVSRLLDKRHGTVNGFKSQSLTQLMDQINMVLDMLTSFIGLVAAISLLVGGIGIMNIMLVTVKERTREIGIRKAVGATNKEILRQFLIEAIILTVLGGIIGMILGYTGGMTIGMLFNLEVKLTVGMIVFAVGTSSAIGILFGVYPAYQASKLDPVEALRYE